MKNSFACRRRCLAVVAMPLAIFSSPFVSDAAADCVVPPAGLVSWWQGETNALDRMGLIHGTLVGNTTYGPGQVGQSFAFDGDADAVNLGNPASLQMQNFTIEAWIKRASPTRATRDPFNINGCIFSYGHNGYGFTLLDDGRLDITQVDVGGVFSSALRITDTNYHHVALTKSNDIVRFYIDGAGETAAAYNPGFTFTTPATIGARGDDLSAGFWGCIDEVSIYDRALSATELQTIFAAANAGKCVAGTLACVPAPSGLVSWWAAEGSASDRAGTNHGAFINGEAFAPGEVGQAFNFWGTNHIEVPAAASLNVSSFTIEAWIFPEEVGITKPIAEYATATGYPGVHLWLSVPADGSPGVTPGSLYANIGSIFGPYHFGTAGGAIAAGQWTHVALTFDQPSGVAQLFVNGTNLATLNMGDITPETALPLNLGYRPAGSPVTENAGYHFVGKMDEVSIYSRALPNAEIQAIYNAGIAGKCPPSTGCVPGPAGLVSWWRGELNALDQAGTNNGTLAGNATYGEGRVGQGFVLDGVGDGILCGNPTNLQLQDFTIETWIKRSSTVVASFDNSGAVIFGYGSGGYALGILDNGTPYLTRVEVDNVMPNTTITDTNLHHLAVTKSGASVVFYVDGVSYVVPPYHTAYTFATPAAIGVRGDTVANGFFGTLDELAVYDRPLSAGEIQSIYLAGSNGKCLTSTQPFIISQPVTQSVTVGENATFSVVASGAGPLSYQWRLNATNIAGATAASLLLTNVQLADAGVYSVVISNSFGTLMSSNAVLTVSPPAPCFTPPSGLISWWRGEGDALDEVGANHGTPASNTSFGAGRVHQAFVFDGSGGGVALGNPLSLQLQDFTIEAWLKRASTTQASLAPSGGGIFGYGYGGYILGMLDDGTLFLSRVGIDNVMPNTAITDTNLHHVAVTKLGANVVFYVDGVAYLGPPYNTSYTFATPAAIGARGDTLGNSFLGTIDEVSVYNRPLSGAEIQGIFAAGGSGKCVVSFPAFIVTQPANLSVLLGASTTFSVAAGGTPPFSYQWRFNGTSILDATNATLTLANVQASQAGNYAVAVANAASLAPVVSSNATLTLTYPPANLRLLSTNIVSGHPVTLPIRIAANGNENAVSFSLNYTAARLTYSSAQLGDFPPGTYFFVNTSQTNLGRLGVTVVLPSGATFAPGSQVLVGVTFDATIWLSPAPTVTTVSFGDVPMARGLTDVNALTLPATYTSGSVTVAGTDLEGDLFPRPGGSRSFTVNDFVQAGRFAAKLDLPAAGGEFQRADSAPRSTQGDGQITVMDWVQAGLYFAGSQPLTAVGGPTVEGTPTGPLGPDAQRAVRVGATNAVQGVAFTLPVSLQAQGNENGVGFTVSFDPAAFGYQAASLGSGAPGANFNLNTNQAGAGKIGVVLVLPTGNSFAAGARELARVNLLPTAVGNYAVTLSDQLVLRGVSDPAANELPASYLAGTVVVNPHPTLQIIRAGTNVALSWPASAAGFNLQSATNAIAPGGWSDVSDTPQPAGDSLQVTLPLTNQTKYFRLRHP